MIAIRPGQTWEPLDSRAASAYERKHGGPMRLVVQSVSDGSPWALVVARTCTGSAPTLRCRRLRACDLVAGWRLAA